MCKFAGMNDNGRIARNTLLLYFRMLFLTVVNLVTVRVVLGALGQSDYGISSVVGSAVYTLAFLTGTLSSASQRYFAYHLGERDTEGYRKTFSILLMSFLAFGAIVMLVGESVSPWIVTDWLNIPADREYAAAWVYQTSLVSFVLSLLQVPYTSSMVAHERMNGFAYVSIADGLFKLGVAYMVAATGSDRLILYSVLSTAETAMVLLLYYLYCRRFEGCRFRPVFDRVRFRELTGYTGWNLFGSVSGMLVVQGQSILLNIFFGPVINTAKGIADRIASLVQSFSSNFYMAVSPQIIKNYASGERDRMLSLVINSSRFSFFLLLLLVFPSISVVDPLLHIWLKEGDVSDAMVVFSRLTLLYCLVVSLEQPITQMIRATGRIRRYQISVGVVTLSYLPLAALGLWLGLPAQSTMWILIAIYLSVMFVRVGVARRQVQFPVGVYLRRVISPIALTCALLVIPGVLLESWRVDSVAMLLLKGATAMGIAAVVILLAGVNREERIRLVGLLRR